MLVLRTYRNTLADGDSNLLAIAAGPFREVVVRVSEGFINGLDRHVSDDSSLTARSGIKIRKSATSPRPVFDWLTGKSDRQTAGNLPPNNRTG
jgi:hypothetical protein